MDSSGKFYDVQHGDVQPSNIFYEEETETITLIDVGGMGQRTSETDAEHFAKSLQLMASTYGADIATRGIKAFDRGYNSKSIGVM